MSMNPSGYEEMALFLIESEVGKREVERFTKRRPELTVEDGYRIQEALIARKLEQGYRVIGPKMGLTSRAKMKQMNVEEPIYGFIFDYMVVEGDVLRLDELIHPKVEAEIAFVLAADVQGPGVTAAQVLAATEYVVPALEIIDSRYEDFQFALPDVVADNASSSRVFIGSGFRSPVGLELDLIGVTLSINGEWKDAGAGAEVLGHPAESVAMLANMLSRRGQSLKAGQVILSGGITGAHTLKAGDTVTAIWDRLGTMQFRVQG
ncbi:fumarylacetoacetate hydrolase family protein [Paenibacillus sp. YK5]|nr:2-oxo-3-hexenedioate decarboxylase [Paenibacillus naphthalenovorans]